MKLSIWLFTSVALLAMLIGVPKPASAKSAASPTLYSILPTTSYNTTIGEGITLFGSSFDQVAFGSKVLKMQADGNLVLYSGSTVLWADNKNGFGGSSATYRAVMQTDGNFVEYCMNGTCGTQTVAFATNTRHATNLNTDHNSATLNISPCCTSSTKWYIWSNSLNDHVFQS